MSVNSSTLISHSHGNHFFEHLSNDNCNLVFEFLEGESGPGLGGFDRNIIATATVCKDWRDNPFLREARKKSSSRLRQRISVNNQIRLLGRYPTQIIGAFKNSDTISELPRLNLGNREGHTDYIDFVKPEDMSHSVMKFQDIHRRPGFAFKIRAGSRIRKDVCLKATRLMRDAILERDLFKFRFAFSKVLNAFKNKGSVLTIFKPNLVEKRWEWAWCEDGGIRIEEWYKERHYRDSGHSSFEQCVNCPLEGREVKLSGRILPDLIHGRDPDFSLPGHSSTWQKTILVTATALATLAIAFLVGCYFVSERSQF